MLTRSRGWTCIVYRSGSAHAGKVSGKATTYSHSRRNSWTASATPTGPARLRLSDHGSILDKLEGNLAARNQSICSRTSSGRITCPFDGHAADQPVTGYFEWSAGSRLEKSYSGRSWSASGPLRVFFIRTPTVSYDRCTPIKRLTA